MDYVYLEYIGAGGSGEVYLVEDLRTNRAKVFKRFFKHKIDEFEE
jgi:serine/threonine protein kinase